MFERVASPGSGHDVLTATPADPGTQRLLDRLEELERVKAAAAAEQARLTARLAERRTDEGFAAASVGAEVGLARHESPHQGRRLVALARALVDDLPLTMAALERGDINERRALVVAEETRDLARRDRLTVDRELASALPSLGDRQLRWAVQRLVLRTDEDGALRRRERARTRRHVSGRRLGDGMAQVSAIVSDVHLAAIMVSLHERAATETATGLAGGRSHGQLVADLFVERLTGQTTATAVPVTVNLVVSAETLFGDPYQSHEPAELLGHGPVPAEVARRLVRSSPEEQTRIRRVFRFDHTDRLVAMEALRRSFTGPLATLVRIRDQVCRTPWCNGDVRHIDHPTPVARGGGTDESNAQGLCEACNYVKEAPGWRHEVRSDDLERHTVEITTPTGRRYLTQAPSPPGGQRAGRPTPTAWVLGA